MAAQLTFNKCWKLNKEATSITRNHEFRQFHQLTPTALRGPSPADRRLLANLNNPESQRGSSEN